MKFVTEYRDEGAVGRFAAAIGARATKPWTIMEICGGQTHAILKHGLDRLLPSSLTLVHGPGCPVCVTPIETIDAAVALARRPGVTLCSFGDMLRVPGSASDLLSVKAAGGDVRTVYSPLDALALAERQPDREVVFLAVGFETTAPANAMAVYQARARGVRNFSVLVAHVTVPPAMEAILSSPDNRVQGFLAAGHVCTVMGYDEYFPIAARYRVPIVVTGFEPVDILRGIHLCVGQLEEGRFDVVNAYGRSVTREGNVHARRLMEEVFEPADRNWRGMGVIPRSGLGLRAGYRQFDAMARFDLGIAPAAVSTVCMSGDVLRGVKRPPQCPAFGTECTPERPLGAPMVSSEGACAAYYRHRAGGS
ncbi:MAG: hydrogenase formation protein HypD [Vicinamibacterales bacterium]